MIYLLDSDTFIFMLQGIKRAASQKKRARARKILAKCRTERAMGHVIGLSCNRSQGVSAVFQAFSRTELEKMGENRSGFGI